MLRYGQGYLDIGVGGLPGAVLQEVARVSEASSRPRPADGYVQVNRWIRHRANS